MARDKKTIGSCPNCSGENLTCTYNFFDRNELVIHAWEHKCLDCGLRDTTAWRSDDEDGIPDDLDPAVCPYCGRTGDPE